ncbi:MAG: hypothetical protein IKO56_02025 [Alphaproteobacteria bacterium]|nr:hypothetical protein [Alphaproteobacteria bacterium]
MEIKEITQQASQTQAKGQPIEQQQKPKPNQNIVIEFSSLPKELKTKEVREFYDKDGSGFLESQNSKGQNEIALMADLAKSLGIDLSKYKSNITKVVRTTANHEGPCEVSRAYDANGKFVMDLLMFDDGDVATFEKSTTQPKFSKVYRAAIDYKMILEQKINSMGGADYGIEKLNNDMTMYTDYIQRFSILEDKNGTVIATEDFSGKEPTFNIYADIPLTCGKNKLVATFCYSGNGYLHYDDISNGKLPYNFDKCSITNTTYTLNGKPVRAKLTKNFQYEITDEKGNVSYLSFWGENLSAEQVRKNQ